MLEIPPELPLHNPANCVAYQLRTDPDPNLGEVHVHVGVNRVREVIENRLRYDATQRKHLVMVIGPSKSGKTSETMIIAPHILSPHILKAVRISGGKFPCQHFWIDCIALRNATTVEEKFSIFCSLVSRDSNEPVVNFPSNTSYITTWGWLVEFFRNQTHYTIVGLDEYPHVFYWTR